jgi:1-acyl-sn-glycerol-3-phosphate acyltransferase
MRAGGRVAFFPEGTSTDNRRVLPFRAPLFAALGAPGLPAGVAVQPVTLRYDAPLLAWYGGTELGPHLLAVLAAPGPLGAAVTVHPPIAAAGRDRKYLAAQAEAAVRSAL